MDTKTALHEAYTGEAKAALRLKVYAEKADQEFMAGWPETVQGDQEEVPTLSGVKNADRGSRMEDGGSRIEDGNL